MTVCGAIVNGARGRDGLDAKSSSAAEHAVIIFFYDGATVQAFMIACSI